MSDRLRVTRLRQKRSALADISIRASNVDPPYPDVLKKPTKKRMVSSKCDEPYHIMKDIVSIIYSQGCCWRFYFCSIWYFSAQALMMGMTLILFSLQRWYRRHLINLFHLRLLGTVTTTIPFVMWSGEHFHYTPEIQSLGTAWILSIKCTTSTTNWRWSYVHLTIM